MILEKKRRTKNEILIEILVFCKKEPKMITHIIYACNLEPRKAYKFIKELENKKLIIKCKRTFKTTQKGKDVVKEWNEFMELFNNEDVGVF